MSNTSSTSADRIELQGGSGGGENTPWSQPPAENSNAQIPISNQVPNPNVQTPAPTVVQQIAEAPKQIAEQITEIIKQLAKTPQQLAQNIQIISKKISDVSKEIAQLIVSPLREQPGLQRLGPLAQAVPKEAPPVFQGWDIMTTRPIGGFMLLPVESDIAFFADKVPQFGKALTALGIDVNKISDVQKVSGTELYLPGLTQVVLTQDQILAINNKIDEQKGLVAPGIFEINKFAAVQGVPIADLSAEAKQKIPSDIVFARTGGELIDYKIGITIDKKGMAQQRIKTISGKPIQLVIKIDQPAKRVTGFISLKKSAVGQNKEPSKVLGFISRISGAALIASMQDVAQQKSEEGLLINKFAYVELDIGIYTANITAPQNEGEYEISTVIEYKDILLAPKEAKLTAIVNPEGYVYSQLPDGRLRIKGASVSLYWSNSNTQKYELWQADKFLQKNPIVTDETGKYSFLAPKGTYKLKAMALNYENYESASFEMNEEIAVSYDIELKKKTGLAGMLNWQNLVIAMLFVVIVLLCIIIVFFIKRSKKNKTIV